MAVVGSKLVEWRRAAWNSAGHRGTVVAGAARLAVMTVLWTTLLGAFFGFAFGVGCALAVMYSIYMGGYRAAVKDSRMETPPERLTKALAKLGR